MNETQVLLTGFEDMHVGLRQRTCECGCGEVFYQTGVGRLRKYMNDRHKRSAYTARKKSLQQDKPLMGTIVKELLELLASEWYPEPGLRALTEMQNAVLCVMAESIIPDIWERVLNELHTAYARGGE